MDNIAFDDTRGRAFQNTAQLVFCCAGLPAAQRIPTTAKLEKWLMATDERPSAAFKDAMAAVLGRLWELARNEELDAPFRRFKAKVSPVEFVFIGMLLLRFLLAFFFLTHSLTHFPTNKRPPPIMQACFSMSCVTATPPQSNPAPRLYSGVTSARPTSTCASTRVSVQTVGVLSTRSRMARSTLTNPHLYLCPLLRLRARAAANRCQTGSASLLILSRARLRGN